MGKTKSKIEDEILVTNKIKVNLEKKIKDSFLDFVVDCKQVIELEENKTTAAKDIKAVAGLMAEKFSRKHTQINR